MALYSGRQNFSRLQKKNSLFPKLRSKTNQLAINNVRQKMTAIFHSSNCPLKAGCLKMSPVVYIGGIRAAIGKCHVSIASCTQCPFSRLQNATRRFFIILFNVSKVSLPFWRPVVSLTRLVINFYPRKAVRSHVTMITGCQTSLIIWKSKEQPCLPFAVVNCVLRECRAGRLLIMLRGGVEFSYSAVLRFKNNGSTLILKGVSS